MKLKTMAGAGAMIAAGVLSACGPAEKESNEPVRPVITHTVKPPAARQRSFSGTARNAQETPLSARVSGELVGLPIAVGDAVKKGAVIARIDPTEFELQLKQARAQLAQAEAQYAQAKAENDRMRQLYETRSVSKSDLDTAAASFKSARASRESAAKTVEQAEVQLSYCTVKAPFDGVIAAVPVEKHVNVSPGQTIATLAASDDMEMLLGVPENVIGDIEPGQPATVTFDAMAGRTYRAVVKEAGVLLDASSTYPVRLTLRDRDERIRSGMVGEARFMLDAEGDGPVIHVPPASVMSGPSGEQQVWVFDEEKGVVNRRPVAVGVLTSDGIEIKAGLDPGEIIVTRGVHKLMDGMRVRLMEE